MWDSEDQWHFLRYLQIEILSIFTWIQRSYIGEQSTPKLNHYLGWLQDIFLFKDILYFLDCKDKKWDLWFSLEESRELWWSLERFRCYTIQCPHHGFSKEGLLSTLYRGVVPKYISMLDTGSNEHFLETYEKEGVKLGEKIGI